MVVYIGSRKEKFISLLLIGAIALALFDVSKIALSALRIAEENQKLLFSSVAKVDKDERASTFSDDKVRPNVYFILMDMMFGEEVFNKFEIPNNILNSIENHGFRIIKRAHSNAPVTRFSLPHIFNMNYYLENGERVTRERLHGEISAMFGGGNEVYQGFRERDYKVYALFDGYWGGCDKSEDKCLNKIGHRSHEQQDLRFLERTPFYTVLQRLDAQYNLFSVPMNLWFYPNRTEVPELIRFLPDAQEGPFFVYTHLMLPHYPLRFDRNCNYHQRGDVIKAYAEQYICAVKYLGLLINEIRNRDENALIIAHSDHGVSMSKQHLKQVEDLTEEEIIENLSIFSAFKIPSQCEQNLYDTITPVNTFRIVFSCLDNTKPNLLDDRSFLVYYPKWPSGGKVREWHYQVAESPQATK